MAKSKTSRGKNLSLSIVVPVYNEEAAIGETLGKILKVCDGLGADYEVLVIDDASTDSTPQIIKRHKVTHIRHPYNMGNGAAVKRGIRAASKDVILLMDGDGQHDPQDIGKFMELIKDYDMVVGARTKDSQSQAHRNLANSVYNLAASYVCGRKIPDLTSGYRAIRRNVAKRFVYLMPNTFSYPTTLTLSLHRAGFSTSYLPIKAAGRKGKSKISIFRDGFRFLVIILRIAVFFAPLKMFLPVSVALLLAGLGWYIYRFTTSGILPLGAVLLMITGLLVLVFSLISEQISYLRYQHSEPE